tara:strand:- start:3946 stop:4785 length:840 start_codon:yes stop_codon:yes gene_type:complete
MAYLLTTTFIWAFSFSLIGHYLSPIIDSWSLSFFRTLIALLVFIPFIDFKISRKHILFMILIGAIQIGIMYLMYLNAFKFTSVSKILLFTITTPLYVTFIADLIEKKFRSFFLMLSIASIVGASFLRFNSPAQNDLIGFFLIQGANFCFALGQVLYKFFEKWTGRIPNGMSDFAYFYIGALIFTTVGFLSSDVKTPLPNDIATWLLIVWMGVGASGLGFYFWDKGSLFVSSGTLAVMNNLVIPLGLMVEILFFGQALNSETYLIGTLIIVVSILVSLRK